MWYYSPTIHELFNGSENLLPRSSGPERPRNSFPGCGSPICKVLISDPTWDDWHQEVSFPSGKTCPQGCVRSTVSQYTEMDSSSNGTWIGGGTFSVPFGVVSPKFQSLNSTSTIFCHIHAPSILLLTLFFTLNQIITLKHLFQKEFDLVSQVENSIPCQKQEAIITVTIIHTKHFLKF